MRPAQASAYVLGPYEGKAAGAIGALISKQRMETMGNATIQQEENVTKNYLPLKPVSYRDLTAKQKVENGPWSERVKGQVYMKLQIAGGNMATNNVMQIRVMPPPTANARNAEPGPNRRTDARFIR